MSNDPLLPPSNDEPARPKTGIAQKLRRLVTILVLVVVAVLAVRTVAFALLEKKYQSTALILLKEELEAFRASGVIGWGRPVSARFLDADLAERAQAQMRVTHPDMQFRPCEISAAEVSNTFNVAVSATANDPTYALVYLDALIDAFLARDHDEAVESREAIMHAMKQEIPKLAHQLQILEDQREARELKESDSQKITGEIANLKSEKAECEKALETLLGRPPEADQRFAVRQRATPAVKVIPRFTFLRFY